MTLVYKFRNTSSDSLKYTLDILENQRLYCAESSNLDDPNEGKFNDVRMMEFYTSAEDLFTQEVPIMKDRVVPLSDEQERNEKELRDLINKYRICALCLTYKTRALWSQYADGNKGIAIEMDIPENFLHQVRYQDELPHTFWNELERSKIESEAISNLTAKLTDYSYQKEVRIIQQGTYFDLFNNDAKITKVIFGRRIDKIVKKDLKKLCREKGIPTFKEYGSTSDVQLRELN